MNSKPGLVVFASLFPSSVRPNAGVFIRERMFRVGQHLPLVVVSPVPWFPFQGLIRHFRPGYRPMPARVETQGQFTVHYPRFLSVPGLLRSLDGLSMAVCSLPLLLKLKRQGYGLIDGHFAYPDGYAAMLLGRWLKLPATITLRGTEVPMAKSPVLTRRMLAALKGVPRVFAVADSLRQHMAGLGANPDKIRVIGNGVDTSVFRPMDRATARQQLNLPAQAKILVSVGGLVERKGFHRVIELLPELKQTCPDLVYLIVGGGSPEGDILNRLKQQVADLGLSDVVRFLGAMPPKELHVPLSAADVFVLATSNEGWANVFLEAMATGLPVITTDVGGNREVVASSELGTVVPFGDPKALLQALQEALQKKWDRSAILKYASDNSWDTRIPLLLQEFHTLMKL